MSDDRFSPDQHARFTRVLVLAAMAPIAVIGIVLLLIGLGIKP